MEYPKKEPTNEIDILLEELQNYFANTIIPQFFVDANLILRIFTPAAIKQFSFTADDIGKHIVDVIHHIRYDTLVDNINEVIVSGTSLEKEIQTTDNKWYQMNILPYIVRNENKTNGVIITFIDITHRIIALKEMAKLNKGYETFIYGIVHDIRQPLNNIIMISDLLIESYQANKNEEFVILIEFLKKTSENINALVADFTKYVNNKTETSTVQERVNIEDIVNDVELTLKETIVKEKVILKTEFETSEIIFSRMGLRSIVYNLVSNAIKYKKIDEPVEITISTSKTDGYVLLFVKDNGLGIDEQDHDRIFNKFVRLSDTVDGTGMGLFVIKSMVEDHGGMIKVNSSPGSGSTFTVYFKSV